MIRAVPGARRFPGAVLILLGPAVQVNRLLRGGEIPHGQDHGVLGGVGAEVARHPAARPGREAVSLRAHARIPGRWPG